MFEAEPNLWLQLISFPWFDALMRFMSWIGNSWFYMPAILVLVFGIRLRAGMGVLLALILVAFGTDCIKQGFGLPRPSEVDARVLDKGRSDRYLVADGAADSFWGLPDREAIETVRATGRHDYGFVSGHTSVAVALALGLALFFHARAVWIWALAIAWPLLMGVSRMYLGRHFLAPGARAWRNWSAALAAACALAVAAWWLPWINPGTAGELAGTLLCIGALMRIGWPDDDTGLARRAARVACALALGYGVTWLFDAAYAASGWPERHAAAFLFAAAGYVAAIMGTVLVARRLGLYRRPAPTGLNAS